MVGISLEIQLSTYEIDKKWSNMVSIRRVELLVFYTIYNAKSSNYDSTTIWLRYQSFENRLEDEPRVGIPIRQSLLWVVITLFFIVLSFRIDLLYDEKMAHLGKPLKKL